MPVTRIGDCTSGICNPGYKCCPHGRCGSNLSGSPNVFANGRDVHREFDIGKCNCPHGGIYESVSCSESVFVNGLGVTRIGDFTKCEECGVFGVHTGGSKNVFAG